MEQTLELGRSCSIDGKTDLGPLALPAHHLVTHGVIMGMTGSGKTGLVTVVVEEALRAGIPVLMLDVKGDLPNLKLALPTLATEALAPWVEAAPGDADGIADAPLVEAAAAARRHGLASWGIGEPELADFAAHTNVRVLTPGADAGELLHLLSSLERRSSRWDTDVESARTSLGAAVSLVLRLLGREAAPGRSREHALLSVLAERRLLAGKTAEIAELVQEVLDPPIETIGALPLDAFLSRRARSELAARLNTLLAAPSFASWRRGVSLDVAEWMAPIEGKTPATIVSVAHLDDEERTLVLGLLLEEILTWVRSLPGSQRLRALVVFDEVYGYLPPHPANPPTKRPLVALMKQARAYGVGCVLATQNPMDLDYRALGNAGLWCLGRLQTDADRERVVEALGGLHGAQHDALDRVLRDLAPRFFVVRDAQAEQKAYLLQPRWAMSYLRGPMTRSEIKRAVAPSGARGDAFPLPPIGPSTAPAAHHDEPAEPRV